MSKIRRSPLSITWLAIPRLLFFILFVSQQPYRYQVLAAQARTCVTPPNGDEHQCTDNPLLLSGAINERGEQTSRYNLGLAQRIDGTEAEKKAIVEVLGRMDEYYIQEVLANPEYATVRPRCQNLNELCAFWVAVGKSLYTLVLLLRGLENMLTLVSMVMLHLVCEGECESNRMFMLSNCAAACRFCLLLNTNI